MQYPISTLGQLSLILKGFRKQKGMTQAALAKQLNVTQQAIAKLEASPEKSRVETLFRVLRLLDASLVLADAGSAQNPSTQVIGVGGISSLPPVVKKDVARKVVEEKNYVEPGTTPAAQSPSDQNPPTQLGVDSLKVGQNASIQTPKPVIKKREQW